jgi:hypothetical protein
MKTDCYNLRGLPADISRFAPFFSSTFFTLPVTENGNDYKHGVREKGALSYHHLIISSHQLTHACLNHSTEKLMI